MATAKTDMIDAQTAISRVQRQLLLGALLKSLLALFLVGAFFFRGGGLLAAAVVGAWIGISNAGARVTRHIAQAEMLILARQYEQAEEMLAQAIKAFTLSRLPKLLALHHLAALRRAQGKWADCAMLCQTLLQKRLGTLAPLRKTILLMQAQALVELDRPAAAAPLLQQLSRERLSLDESMQLLLVETEFYTRAQAWGQIIPELAAPPGHPAWAMLNSRVQLAELMNSQQAARTQALMGLAALKVGRADWAVWLRGRAELLVDWRKLVADRPPLAELWPGISA